MKNLPLAASPTEHFDEMPLDVEEYWQLAMHAGAARDHHAALTYLKKLLGLQPGHVDAMYLLALQHAEIGLTPRAIDGLKRVVAREPDFAVARFQLGMLLVRAGEVAAARREFATFRSHPDQALCMFADGMTAVADKNHAVAVQKIRNGLSISLSGTPMWATMRSLLEMLTSAQEPAATSTHASQGSEAVVQAYRDASN